MDNTQHIHAQSERRGPKTKRWSWDCLWECCLPFGLLIAFWSGGTLGVGESVANGKPVHKFAVWRTKNKETHTPRVTQGAVVNERTRDSHSRLLDLRLTTEMDVLIGKDADWNVS